MIKRFLSLPRKHKQAISLAADFALLLFGFLVGAGAAF